MSGSLRTRLALLYAGVFLVMAVAVLAIPFLAVSETVQVGSSGPPVIRHPGRDLYPQVSVLLISLATAVAVSLGLGWLLAGRLLRPLRVIVATARDISATNLSRRLGTGRRDDEFSRLGAVVRVRNTGPVIPPAEVDRLFQPFQRLGDERIRHVLGGGREHGGGYGLGLAIVRAIAGPGPSGSRPRKRPRPQRPEWPARSRAAGKPR